MQEAVSNATEAVAQKASSIKDKAGQIKAAAAEKFTAGKERAKKLHHSAEEYVREHPTKCVFGALGIGIVIGLIIRR